MARLSQADVTKVISLIAADRAHPDQPSSVAAFIRDERKRRGKKPSASVKLVDGNGLCLHVRTGSALWTYHYRDGQSMRTRSLGSAADMSPSAARRAREDFAAERRKGRIPRRGLAIINSAPEPTEPVKTDLKRMRFADLIDSYIDLKAASWKVSSREPESHRDLKDGALGKLWAHEISHSDVESELKTRWPDALANAEKFRGRIERVMDHAVAKNARADGPNPARAAIIKQLIPAAPETVHRAAMKYSEVPAFYRELIADGSAAARALAFAILTVARNGEARKADWREVIDAAWIIPGGREERSMKEGDEHAVPLSAAALALLGKPKQSGLIFGPMYRNALLDKLQSLRDGLTVHGFRTAFTSWARKNGFRKELRDVAKAHAVVQSANDAAYERHEERAEQLDTLRPMLQAWSDYVTG
jgi:integrase